MTPASPERLLRLPEAADYLNVPPETLRRHWRVWGLTSHRIGRALMFRAAEIERFIQSRAERAE